MRENNSRYCRQQFFFLKSTRKWRGGGGRRKYSSRFYDFITRNAIFAQTRVQCPEQTCPFLITPAAFVKQFALVYKKEKQNVLASFGGIRNILRKNTGIPRATVREKYPPSLVSSSSPGKIISYSKTNEAQPKHVPFR